MAGVKSSLIHQVLCDTADAQVLFVTHGNHLCKVSISIPISQVKLNLIALKQLVAPVEQLIHDSDRTPRGLTLVIPWSTEFR